MHGIAAVPGGDVWAAGTYVDAGTGVDRTLIERYVPCTGTPTPSPMPGTPGPSPTACALGFSDVHPTDYFYQPVTYLACQGIISGYADGTFRPYAATTRAQMVKIVVLGFGPPFVTPTPMSAYTFHDVPPGAPFFDVIETAAADRIVSGYDCGGPGEPCDVAARPYFRPNLDVTRAQLSKIDVIAAGWDLLNPPPPRTFADVLPGSAFYSVVETAGALWGDLGLRLRRPRRASTPPTGRTSGSTTPRSAARSPRSSTCRSRLAGTGPDGRPVTWPRRPRLPVGDRRGRRTTWSTPPLCTHTIAKMAYWGPDFARPGCYHGAA